MSAEPLNPSLSVRMLSLLVAGATLCLSGCWSYSPYYTPPTYAPQQIQTLPPGSTPYVPGGTTAPGGPTYLGAPGPILNDAEPTPADGYGSPPSTFDQNDDRDVPEYPDPGGSPYFPQGDDSGFEQPQRMDEIESYGSVDDPVDSTVEGDSEVPLVAVDEFQPPVQSTAMKGDFNLLSGKQAALDAKNPYAYDAESYSWLRGVLRYNELADNWHLIYSVNPSQQDLFGGDLTLADHPELKNRQDGNVILVTGAVDATQTDERGKALYAVQTITAVAPQVQ